MSEHLTEQKSFWVKEGAALENLFIQHYGEKMTLMINPAKEKNQYLPDLLNYGKCQFAELKTQITPFFSAQSKYGISPQWAFTFDEYSAMRYSFYYPDIELYLWVRYEKQEKRGDTTVERMNAIFKVNFKDLHNYLRTCPLHIQSRRANLDTLNKTVFIMDLSNPVFTRVK